MQRARRRGGRSGRSRRRGGRRARRRGGRSGRSRRRGGRERRAGNKTAFFGVYLNKPGQPKPYRAKVRSLGKQVNLGSFATAEEASLCVARSPEGRAAAAVTPPPPRT